MALTIINKMPIPTPTPLETRDEYVSRCIQVMRNEGKDERQAAAICYTSWSNS